jgi:hypothetical protein
VVTAAETKAAADTTAQEKAALAAAQSWLKLVDSRKYAESWKEAASLFKKAVTQEQWAQAAEKVRSPLGAVSSRKKTNSMYAKNPTGAPEGEYVTIQFETTFAQKKDAIETVMLMLDTDKKWRVSGYFIK